MAVIFSAHEIIAAAVEKEKKRRGFYASVTELSTDEEMKKLFRFLTEEEERHVAAFTQIRDSLSPDDRAVEYDEDMDAYMDSVIDDRLYSRIDSKEFIQNAIDDKRVIRMAIEFEKDAILYFREFLPFLTEADKKVVEDLIDQEKGHIRKLAEVGKLLGQ